MSKSPAKLLEYNEILIFGASDAAYEVEEYLKSINKNVIGYIDNDLSKKDKIFNGKCVIHPVDLVSSLKKDQAIVIASSYQYEIAVQLIDELKINHDRVFPYINKMFSCHFSNDYGISHTQNLNFVLSNLADQESIDYLNSLVEFRSTMDPRVLSKNPMVVGFYHYSNPNLGPFENDYIVDVGAFNGDSAINYLNRLNNNARIMALEPSNVNYNFLLENIKKNNLGDQIYPFNIAAGSISEGGFIVNNIDDEQNPRLKISHDELNDHSKITIETIDNLANFDVDFIKIDVEGYELDVISGSMQTIKKYKPGLAIAAYHKPHDIWDIVKLINNICPGYVFYLGHHPTAVYECEIFAYHKTKKRI